MKAQVDLIPDNPSGLDDKDEPTDSKGIRWVEDQMKTRSL